MPSNREAAQRYAAASRKRKRRPVARPGQPGGAAEKEEPLVTPSLSVDDSVAVAAPAPRAPSSGPRVQRSRPAVVRRPFSDYRHEYAYVLKDLRRVAIVAGSLLVLLLVLDFVVK